MGSGPIHAIIQGMEARTLGIDCIKEITYSLCPVPPINSQCLETNVCAIKCDFKNVLTFMVCFLESPGHHWYMCAHACTHAQTHTHTHCSPQIILPAIFQTLDNLLLNIYFLPCSFPVFKLQEARKK